MIMAEVLKSKRAGASRVAALFSSNVFPEGTQGEPDALAKQWKEWALRQGAPDKLWIVLVKGSPTDLMKATQRRFYFDQMGALTGKFGIAHTPALLVQQGDHLDIREVALARNGEHSGERR